MGQLLRIDEPEAVRAISDANRLDILRLIMARPQTISSLGRALGKHPAWIRHHVVVLESVGLVRLAEERTTRNYTEKIYAASAAAYSVSLLVRPNDPERPTVVALVSHDLAVDLLAAGESEDVRLAVAVTGSLDGLVGLRQGLADIAGCHLLDTETGEYNIPYARHLFPDRDVVVVTLAHREQGLMVAPGNPLRLRTFADVTDSRARFVNRNRGSGTRLWIDRALAEVGASGEHLSGYDDAVDTHTEAALRVASGEADAALGIAAAATAAGLEFVPLFRERYDLVMLNDVYETEEVGRLLDRLHTASFRRSVAHMSGYDPSRMGDEYRLAV